jgi:hypothetical protein
MGLFLLLSGVGLFELHQPNEPLRVVRGVRVDHGHRVHARLIGDLNEKESIPF